MFDIGGMEDTSIRSTAARSIVETEGLLIIKMAKLEYIITDVAEEKRIHCQTWAGTERVLLRLGIPAQKLNEIKQLLGQGVDVSISRKPSK